MPIKLIKIARESVVQKLVAIHRLLVDTFVLLSGMQALRFGGLTVPVNVMVLQGI
ncbi:MAG: hypothetical protein JRJ11_02920 [Deltaproteobacteria bacterium]|nr:hypothetical protein [Deltaproteobacteria bacterium]MBW1726572.1 hypothetical protein [Deltaproteobacteria bacterium]MBW1908485.1 hypothetical protein [Deltaproteobacteria bacterium]MBW2032891.1 hypothetical protein [Deltaproteobacteria bacterium]MBW2113866.1 hypothetical protein [Deltaproteobacteria bacterium]